MIREARPVVLVTGSSGRIGGSVARRLREDGYEVVGLDAVEPPGSRPARPFIRCDLTSSDDVERALGQVRHEYGGQIASVVHLAAERDRNGEPAEEDEQVTVAGTQRLLRRLKRFDHVGQFVFSSTMRVHALCRPGERINELWPLDPRGAYPQARARAEQVLLTEHEDIPCVILRLATVYDDACHAPPLAHQLQRIAEDRITGHLYPGNTAHGQAMIHVDDVVEAVARTVDRREDLDDELVLLIGEPETLSYGALQRRFVELVHGRDKAEKWQTRQVPKSVARTGAWVQEHMPAAGGGETLAKLRMIGHDDEHYELDVGRAKRALAWEARHRLADALPRMVAAMQADPEAWYREHGLDFPEAWKQAEGEKAPG